MNMSPKSEASAYRIWAHCRSVGWDITTSDCARELNMKHRSVIVISHLKGWGSRFRTMTMDNQGLFPLRTGGRIDAPSRMSAEQAQEELG